MWSLPRSITLCHGGFGSGTLQQKLKWFAIHLSDKASNPGCDARRKQRRLSLHVLHPTCQQKSSSLSYLHVDQRATARAEFSPAWHVVMGQGGHPLRNQQNGLALFLEV